MKPILAAVMAAFLLAGCQTTGLGAGYTSALTLVKDAAIKINARGMDDAQKLVCNNGFSAEKRVRTRHSISPAAFDGFCGRVLEVTR